MIGKIQNFVFRGMLLDSDLEALKEAGISITESPTIASEKADEGAISIEDFSARIRLGAIKMSSVYMAFFCFENSVRELIVERLKERVGATWWNKCVSKRIRDTVVKRKSTDSKNRWHAPRAADNISYADFGDMSDIITSNWAHFEDLFPSQDWVKTRLGDLEQSRNALAHNNVLAERDIERIRMYLQDWLMQAA